MCIAEQILLSKINAASFLRGCSFPGRVRFEYSAKTGRFKRNLAMDEGNSAGGKFEPKLARLENVCQRTPEKRPEGDEECPTLMQNHGANFRRKGDSRRKVLSAEFFIFAAYYTIKTRFFEHNNDLC